jgi:NAD(P)-dependent dehydrogenase (short-subunit alcohol dehydrogenase family)
MTTTIALITGANKGIGLETGRQLGARGVTVLAGARDLERGREAERALRAAGADARFVRLDVTDDGSAERAGPRPSGAGRGSRRERSTSTCVAPWARAVRYGTDSETPAS